ncbi:hypothetical protein ICM05_05275 [Leucobacter sp. cx-42]|uniref:hypothetical protein n=1 Tax=unclassified Leucobacter TaxID=2621730 RepID=UPI00165E9E93|nr:MULTISPECIES: hypothetical protein [unclassified Leucobacter]MBC9954057.1 hypothetical protein [Leucobacter sp. cx-42]
MTELNELIAAARTDSLSGGLIDAFLCEKAQDFIDTRMDDLYMAFFEAEEEPPSHGGAVCERCSDEVSELSEGIKELLDQSEAEYTDNDVLIITDFWAAKVAEPCPGRFSSSTEKEHGSQA